MRAIRCTLIGGEIGFTICIIGTNSTCLFTFFYIFEKFIRYSNSFVRPVGRRGVQNAIYYTSVPSAILIR